MENVLMKSIGGVKKRRPVRLTTNLHAVKNVLVFEYRRIDHALNNKLMKFAGEYGFSQQDAVNYILARHFANDH